MDEVAFRLEGVTKRYHGRVVLRIDSLELAKGVVHVFLGPNGAGKTTFLRLLALLEEPTGGAILFAGRPVHPRAREALLVRRRVGIVPQNPVMLARTVYENVAYGLRVRRTPEAEARERVMAAMAAVGLDGFGSRPAVALSAGEIQRVAVARALALGAPVLLLDEPTAGLDPSGVARIEEAIRSANANLGTTVVMVTHDVFQARRMGDMVGLMLGGEIVERAEAETFFGSPQDTRTRAFLGGELVS